MFKNFLLEVLHVFIYIERESTIVGKLLGFINFFCVEVTFVYGMQLD